MHHSRSTRRRLALALVTVVALFGVCVVRLVDLQVVKADALTKASDQQTRSAIVTYGTRGAIVDSDGTVLAASVQRWDITVSPKVMLSGDRKISRVDAKGKTETLPVREALAELADVVHGDADTMWKAITADPESDYAVLAKGITLATLNKVRALNVPGFYPQSVQGERSYPNGQIAGNLIGYVGKDGPLAGLERTQNACLVGTDGEQSYERSRDFVRVPGSTVETKAAVDGGTLQLTLDADLQYFAQQSLGEQAAAYGAKWANATVIRTKDGHVMAAADWPSVDPNDPTATDVSVRGQNWFSRTYEPGSIMKPMTVSSLLDAGVLGPTDKIVVPSRYDKDFPKGSYIKDVFPHPEMHWTVAGIIENSSNIGISVISERLGLQQRSDYLKRYGFGSKTAVDFEGESAGIMIDPKNTDAISDKAQQFGQAISVTAAQMAGAYQALGNGGVKLPVTLVEGCKHADGTVTGQPSTQGERVVSEAAAKETLEMMETVATTSNIAKTVTIPGYRIGAKTGTAQVATAGGGYGSERVVSVAGITTVDDPEYAVIVTMGEPDRVKTSAAAAPAFAAIMKQVIKTYRVPPSTTPVPNVPLTW